MPLRVVMDTSVLVSYLLSGGKILREIVAAWREGEIDLLASPQTMAELSAVIARPEISQRSALPLASLVESLSQWGIHVPGNLVLTGACRDPKNDKFLACAVEGQAEYLISSDRDLLAIGTYQKVNILNPGQFLAALHIARMPVEALQSQYSLTALHTIQAELHLDTGTKQKLEQAINGLNEADQVEGDP